MKQQVDQHHTERIFEHGDFVFAGLQLYKQMLLNKLNKYNKLEPNYYGTKKVLQNIGSMDYKLELHSFKRVHPFFHVSCLNKVIGDKISIQTIFLELNNKVKFILEPQQIAETRTKPLHNPYIIVHLSKWKNLRVEYSTWEDESFIQKHPQLDKC